MKTVFVIDNLSVGGIATSLMNLLPHFIKFSDCDLIVFSNEFDCSCLPNCVRVFCPSKLLNVLGKPLSKLKRNPFLFLLKIWLLLLSRIFSGKTARKFLFFFLRKRYRYDVAISFCHDNGWKSLSKGCNDFVLNKIDARVKASWVHCDYSSYGGFDARDIKKYEQFDYIIHVSNSCLQKFCSLFPSIKNKCFVVENFQKKDFFNKNASFFEYKKELFNIVTVCRISTVKGLDRAIEAFHRLVLEGYHNFTWTIVGEGPEKNALLNKVKELSLDSMISFIGESNNPQFFMKNADLFLLPSLHEAAPMVFGECAQLKLFVLSTNTCSAEELVLKRGIGVVCDNSIEGIYIFLKKIFEKEIIPRGLDSCFESFSHADENLIAFIKEIHLRNGV